jgi:hypothetical protein
MSKAPTENFVTTKGELVWVFIDGNTTKNLKGQDIYKAGLRYDSDSEELAEVEKVIKDFWKKHKPKGKKIKSFGIKPEMVVVKDADGHVKMDKDDEPVKEHTGKHILTAWTQPSFPDGKEKSVPVYNSPKPPKQPVIINLKGKKIGNGSRGFLSCTMQVYDRQDGAGVALYLNAIQLTHFEEFTGNVVLATPDEEEWDGLDDLDGFNAADESDDDEKPNLELD